MAVKQINQTTSKVREWFELAHQRIRIPNNYVILKYHEDVDLLVVRFTDGKSTHSKDDMDKGIIYSYDENNEIASIEILDLYGAFAKA